MDPMHKELLKNFKELYDEGLLSKEEYEAKKAEVLAMVTQNVRPSSLQSNGSIPNRPSQQLGMGPGPSNGQLPRPSGTSFVGGNGNGMSNSNSVGMSSGRIPPPSDGTYQLLPTSPRNTVSSTGFVDPNPTTPGATNPTMNIDDLLAEFDTTPIPNKNQSRPSSTMGQASSSFIPPVGGPFRQTSSPSSGGGGGSGTQLLSPRQTPSSYPAAADSGPPFGGLPRQTLSTNSAPPPGTSELDYFVEMLAGPASAAKAAAEKADATGSVRSSTAQTEEKFINCEHELLGHKGFVFDVAFHNNRLFTAGADKLILVWDLATMKIIATLQGHLKEVYCLLVDKQYQRLLSGSWDLCINVWSLDKLELQRTLKGHQGYISCMCILGDKLFTGSWDRETRVWDLKTLKHLDTLSIEHTGNIYDVATDGKLIFTASQDKTIKSWNPVSYNFKDTLGEVGGKQHTDWVTALIVDGPVMYSCSRDCSIKVWDLTTRHIKDTKTIAKAHDAAITCMRKKGNYLITGDSKGFIKIWHTETFQCIDTIKAHNDWISNIRIVGDYIFSASRDKSVKIWI